jgi:hypothetical protein
MDCSAQRREGWAEESELVAADPFGTDGELELAAGDFIARQVLEKDAALFEG